MYGLFLMNIKNYITTEFSSEIWNTVIINTKIINNFSPYLKYPLCYFYRLSEETIKVLNISEKDFFENIGLNFVKFLKENGSNQVFLVLGKYLRDFLNDLDYLYEYMKFPLPEIKTLSFICEKENTSGLQLNYRCSKTFLAYYTVGIIKQVAHDYYKKKIVIEEEFMQHNFDFVQIKYRLNFDNDEYNIVKDRPLSEKIHKSLPVTPHLFLQIFPFCIVFRNDMTINYFGNSLNLLLTQAIGKKLSDYFIIKRPSISFEFQQIQSRLLNMFEIETLNPVKSWRIQFTKNKLNENLDNIIEHKIVLKGQMVFLDGWNMMVFLGTPLMPYLEYVSDIGLYMNDLSMHDFSRDLMLAGTQQSATLRLALEQEQEKTNKLEDSLARLAEERRRTDQLLYQMIPESVADTLRKGLSPVHTCQKFNNVSILYSDVVKFTEICSKITAMEVVSMLNGMYSLFDSLTEEYKVYKVETIGDAYTVVSGAPDHAVDHTTRVSDLALNMIKAIKTLHDPSTGSHLKIRIGIHSGPVVAGIVGVKMPRYCLFGETVMIACLMESTSQPMKIHITDAVTKLLPNDFITTANLENLQNKIDIKESLKTFWLESRTKKSKIRTSEDISTTTPKAINEKHHLSRNCKENDEGVCGKRVSNNYFNLEYGWTSAVTAKNKLKVNSTKCEVL